MDEDEPKTQSAQDMQQSWNQFWSDAVDAEKA